MLTNGAKPRARLQILWWVCQFSLMQRHDSGEGYTGQHAFRHVRENVAPPIGSLIAMKSAPLSKWYLSWLIEYQWPAGHNGPTYVLESIEDGEVCNWSNVGIMVYDPESVKDNPQWRWTDKQFAFNDRWYAACNETDGYTNIPMRAEFDGDGVLLRVRQRYNFDGFKPEHYFKNSRQATKEVMRAFYEHARQEIEYENQQIKAQKAAG